jgi:hypothetical protein
VGRRLGGVQGFIEWLALHEPKTAAALFARVLPYFINVGMEVPDVVSETEMEAMLKELGLPPGLIEHMQTAPAPLDLDEDPDPYGMWSGGTGLALSGLPPLIWRTPPRAAACR